MWKWLKKGMLGDLKGIRHDLKILIVQNYRGQIDTMNALDNLTAKVNELIAVDEAQSELLIATHTALLDAIAQNQMGNDGPLNALATQLDTEIQKIRKVNSENPVPTPPAPTPDPTPTPAPADPVGGAVGDPPTDDQT